MLDSDDSDFYIGEQQIKDQEEHSTEIGKNKNLENCALSQTKLKCELVKIVNSRGFPHLHFQIDGKMYFYRIVGVRPDNKIVLQCNKNAKRKPCNNVSTVLPSDSLKEIFQKKTSKLKKGYAKFFDKLDPRVYDINNYDINSFDIGKGHKCPGIEIDVYLKSLNKPEEKPEMKCKLVQIENREGNPNLHFVINRKSYSYEIVEIKADYKIVLRCTKMFLGL